MSDPRSDHQLIDAVLSGNRTSYDALVQRHQRFVFTLALRLTKNREDAEEVAQDAFVKAFRALGTFRKTSKFSTWLYSITYTTAMTVIRRKRPGMASLDAEPELHQATTHDRCLVQSQQRSAYIAQAISTLPPPDAALITLFYQGEQSLEEIGAALNTDAATIKVRLFRARQRFKASLEQLLKHEAAEL